MNTESIDTQPTQSGHPGTASVSPANPSTNNPLSRTRGDQLSTISFAPPPIEPWPHAIDGSILLNELVGHLKKHVILPEHAPEALALWILHTYAFELRDVTAYLGVESPEKRCGKTTLLTLLSKLVNRPVVAANITSSAFFRVIEQIAPTLIIDEADTSLNGNDELRGILNAGYTRDTAFVVRVANDASVQSSVNSNQFLASSLKTENRTLNTSFSTTGLAQFSCWCPKVMAAIGHLPDTLADRCVLIRMKRKTPSETCERLRNFDGATLRSCCARFVLDNKDIIATAQPSIPTGLNDRAADIWEPLFALADFAGEDWPTRSRNAAVALVNSAQDNNPIGALLLDIMLTFVQNDTQRIFTRDLLDALNKREHRPWRVQRNGKPVDDYWLSTQLRPYGVRSKLLRINGEVARGYAMEDLTDIFRRYIPRSEIELMKREATENSAACRQDQQQLSE